MWQTRKLETEEIRISQQTKSTLVKTLRGITSQKVTELIGSWNLVWIGETSTKTSNQLFRFQPSSDQFTGALFRFAFCQSHWSFGRRIKKTTQWDGERWFCWFFMWPLVDISIFRLIDLPISAERLLVAEACGWHPFAMCRSVWVMLLSETGAPGVMGVGVRYVLLDGWCMSCRDDT